MTVTTEMQREARVAGGTGSAPLEPEQDTRHRPEPAKGVERHFVKTHEPRPRAA